MTAISVGAPPRSVGWISCFIVAAMALLLSAGGAAANEAGARKAVVGFANEVVALANSGRSVAQKRAGVQSILTRRADIDKIVRFSAGPFWRKMNSSQRSNYRAAVLPYMSKLFVSFFDQVRGTDTEVKKVTVVKKRIRVETVSRGNGKPKNITWFVKNRDGRLVIQDAVIGGQVSVVISLQNELKALFGSNGGNADRVTQALRANVSKS